jgi:hypothetical protein
MVVSELVVHLLPMEAEEAVELVVQEQMVHLVQVDQGDVGLFQILQVHLLEDLEVVEVLLNPRRQEQVQLQVVTEELQVVEMEQMVLLIEPLEVVEEIVEQEVQVVAELL